MLPLILVTGLLLFIAAYFGYGRFLDRNLDIQNANPTPSHTDYDGVDRVPANRWILLGHHFSSIAGAGPIVGPIMAGLLFGWLPTLLWILLGSILIGGVHDYTTLIASVRNKGRSVADLCRTTMSPLAYKLFLAFIWLTLVYILTVFADMTAGTFAQSGEVASSSGLFILLAVLFGIALYRFKWPVGWASLLFVPLVFGAVGAGLAWPLALPASLSAAQAQRVWYLLLIVYCFGASTLPVWLLLQPRDYLSSFLLYAALLGGFVGVVFSAAPLQYPAFVAWEAPGLGALVPFLFITVACGACSGFHSIVASGTTSKQLDQERDARFVGYGAMLIEGVLALIALCIVAALAPDPALHKTPPPLLFAAGMGRFLALFGLPESVGSTFGLLALSAFLLTTLDTATRLSRYVLEEFFSLRGSFSRYLATAASLLLPALFAFLSMTDPAGRPVPVWKAIWPIFGATNQLLAALALMAVTVWLKRQGRRFLFTLLPALFMSVMTLWSLTLLVVQSLAARGAPGLIGGIAIVLLALAILVITESLRILLPHPAAAGRA